MIKFRNWKKHDVLYLELSDLLLENLLKKVNLSFILSPRPVFFINQTSKEDTNPEENLSGLTWSLVNRMLSSTLLSSARFLYKYARPY